MRLVQAWHALVDGLAEHAFLERLFFSSIELAILASLFTLFLWVFKPRTPRLVTFVWALVLAKPIVTLAIGSPVSLWEVSAPVEVATETSRYQSAEEVRELPSASKLVEHEEAITIEPPNIVTESSSVLPQSPELVATSPTVVAPTISVIEQPIQATAMWSWSQVVWLWGAGVAAMLIRAAFVRFQVRGILLAGRSPQDWLAVQYQSLVDSLQLRNPPQLRVSAVFESPALVGLWWPRILLPAWLVEANDRQAIEWSLKHELTHWRHGDLWLIRLRELSRILFYFHPVAWWAGKRMEEAMEFACDRAVIASDAEAADYAQRLYQLLDAVRNHRRHPLAAGLFATRSQIAKRLVMLVESPLKLRPKLSKRGAFGMLALSLVVLTVGVGVRREATAEDPKPGDVSDAPGDREAEETVLVGEETKVSGKAGNEESENLKTPFTLKVVHEKKRMAKVMLFVEWPEGHGPSQYSTDASGLWRSPVDMTPKAIYATTDFLAGVLNPKQGQTIATLTLVPAAIAKGTIVDDEGFAVPNQLLRCSPMTSITASGRDGTFQLIGMVPGVTYTVQLGGSLTGGGGSNAKRTWQDLKTFKATEAGDYNLGDIVLPAKFELPKPDSKQQASTGKKDVEGRFAESLWKQIGIRGKEVTEKELKQGREHSAGGVQVTEVRPKSLAAASGIQARDVVIGLGKWDITSIDNLKFALRSEELYRQSPIKVFILREGAVLSGEIPIVNNWYWLDELPPEAEPKRLSGMSLTRPIPLASQARNTDSETEVAPAAAAPAIEITDVELIEKDENENAICRFKVKGAVGSRFYFSYHHNRVRGATGSYHEFEIEDANGAEMELKFSFRSDSKADRSKGVWWSQEESVGFQVQAKGCRGSQGFSTIVSAPIFHTPSDDHTLRLFSDEKVPDAKLWEEHRRLIFAYPKSQSSKPIAEIEPSTGLIVGPVKAFPDPPPVPLLEQLKRKWASQENSIGSAHIQYRHTLIGGSTIAPLSPKEVREILAKADLESHPENFIAAVRATLADKSIAEKPYGEGEFFCLGIKTRSNNEWHTRVFDGEIDLRLDKRNRQLDVYPPNVSSMGRTTLREFRRPVELPAKSPEVVAQADGKLLLRLDASESRFELVADSNTGFVSRTTYHRNYDKDSHDKETWQFAPVTHPGGIILPTLLVEATYTRNELDRLEVWMLDKVEVNGGVEKGTFELAVPEGTKAFIRASRDEIGNRSTYVRIPADVPNVAEYLRKQGKIEWLGKARVATPIQVTPVEATNAAKDADSTPTAPQAVSMTVFCRQYGPKPVPNAQLTISYLDEDGWWQTHATATEAGIWRSSEPTPPRAIYAVSADGKLAGYSDIVHGTFEVEINLMPAASATGMLVDSSNRPVANRVLRYGIPLLNHVTTMRNALADGKNRPVYEMKVIGKIPSKIALGGKVVTDAAGRYQLSGLVAGQTYHVVGDVPGGKKPVTIATFVGDSTKTLELGQTSIERPVLRTDQPNSAEPGATIAPALTNEVHSSEARNIKPQPLRGKVFDADGKPAANATVIFETTVPEDERKLFKHARTIREADGRVREVGVPLKLEPVETNTKPDGSFELQPNLLPGTVLVFSADKLSFGTAIVKDSSEEVEIRLRKLPSGDAPKTFIEADPARGDLPGSGSNTLR